MFTNTEATEILKSATQAIRATFARHGATIRLNPAILADLSQEAYIRTCEYFQADRGTIGAMANKCGTSLAVDFLRGRNYAGGSKETVVSAFETDNADGESLDIVAGMACPNADFVTAGINAQTLAILSADLAEAIESLPTKQKEAVTSYLSNPDVATGAERVSMHRALKALREAMA